MSDTVIVNPGHMIRNTFIDVPVPRSASRRRVFSADAVSTLDRDVKKAWRTAYFRVRNEAGAMKLLEQLPPYESAFFLGNRKPGLVVVFASAADAAESRGIQYAVDGEDNVRKLLKDGVVQMANCAKLENRRGEKSGHKIFVGKLKSYTNKRTLRNYFKKSFGLVSDCGIVTRPDGSSAGFGYCTFASEASAQACLNEPNHLVDGSYLAVRPYKSRVYEFLSF